VLSHYRLSEKIGEGGMGEVWKARDTRLDRDVALKFLPRPADADSESVTRFAREARALAALNHPNIIAIYSVEETLESRFLVMELVPGRRLGELIPERGLPLERFFEWAIPMTEAISAAHERGVIHGDLKPANVMVTDEGRLKVLDFGLARIRERPTETKAPDLPTETLNIETRLSGTMPYMAPEQIQGRPGDHRSDLFSLGIILYELISGKRPFRGETSADMIASILKDEPVPLTDVDEKIPRSLWRIVKHALEKDPRRRFQAALDLRNELQEIVREIGTVRREFKRSIAVLPFADMSPERDQDYFCEGMAEEIINALNKVQELHVASRTSSFQFKAEAMDSREIGRRLGVTTLLEGSVRKAGDRLRITVELVEAAEGYHIWSERYDRELEDVFAIQDEISLHVVQALQLALSPKESDSLAKPQTAHVQAYDCYLKGRKYYYRYARQGMEFAREMFSRAIEIDPAYARAWAGISDCSAWLYVNAGRDEAHRAEADESSAMALELDQELAEAHASRGMALSLLGRDSEAEQVFERAALLNPELFEAHYFFARHSFSRGELEKAARLFEQANEVRPDDYQSSLLAGQVYEDMGRKAEAAAVRRRGVRIAEDRLKLSPDDARAWYMGANGLVALGERERGLEWAARALELDPEEPMLLYNVACIESLAGRIEPAIEYLERSITHGLVYREWILNDSNLAALRDHPRFAGVIALLEK